MVYTHLTWADYIKALEEGDVQRAKNIRSMLYLKSTTST